MHYPPAFRNPLQTRDQVQTLLRDLMEPLIPHFSPGRARLRIGAAQPWYGEPAASLEAFARSLWGLLPLALGGGAFAHWPLWREGLKNGSDPEHPEFWGYATDFDQRSVETPILALACALLPDELWTPFSPQTREQLLIWFANINHVKVVGNNWLFFRVLTNLALERLGGPVDVKQREQDLATLDSFYLGEGWYSDGKGRIGDYYVGMAFHVYGVLFAKLCKDPRHPLALRFRERARRFALDFQHWFSADGEALPFGRSLSYRSAQGAFWGALAYAEEQPLPWGVLKGLHLRNLRWWMRQPLFTETGLLTVGYRYPNLLMAENYNGPGSPYWACKIFLPLALPAEHPFWLAEEAPLPARPSLLAVPGAGQLLSSPTPHHQVLALNAGQPVSDYPRHAAAKYSKIAYSTGFGFGVQVGGSSLACGGFDSTISLSEDGVNFRARDNVTLARVHSDHVYSLWTPWPGVELETWAFAHGDVHLRVHRLRSQRRLLSSDGGFSLGLVSPAQLQQETGGPGLLVLSAQGFRSALRDLGGWDSTGASAGPRAGRCVLPEPNSDLSNPLVATPFLIGEHEPGEHWFACLVEAKATPEPADTLLNAYELQTQEAYLNLGLKGQSLFRLRLPGN